MIPRSMAPEMRRLVVCVVVAAVILAAFLGIASPSSAAPTPPCPFSTGSPRTFSIGGPAPRPLNPCPGQEWARTVGPSGDDYPKSFVTTADGGFVFAVVTYG